MFVSIIIFLCSTTAVLGEDCVLDIKSPNKPLVLDGDLNFITSYLQDSVHFAEGETFYLKCSSSTVTSIIAETGDPVVCIGGLKFFHIRLDKVLTFDKLTCKDNPPAHTTRQLNEPCANNFTEIELGIQTNQSFIRAFTICFDNVHLVPFYAEFTKPSYDCEQEGNCDDDYNLFIDAGDFYNVDLEYLYEEAGEILGELALYEVEYLQLIPKKYFLNPVQWYPTFDYLNLVFHWKPYSWFSPYTFCMHYLPEDSVIYNGVLGVSVSKIEGGEYEDLYLSNGTVPIPKWYWCVFYDTSPEIDGRFYIDFGTPYSSIPKSDIENWWKTELCTADTFVYIEQGFFYGTCLFGEVINPLLENFIDSKWPAARTTSTVSTTPS